MDLSTTYLGLTLAHPLMPGASPMVDDLDLVRRLEDAGAAAIVMHSLFEEQIAGERRARRRFIDAHAEAHPEARSYFPSPDAYALGPDEYLGQIEKIKKAVRVPVIASLNGTTPGGWLDYARFIERAGADALELNAYFIATDPRESGPQVEERTLRLMASVREAVRIPVAVKLSPFHASLPHFAGRLAEAGADGLVLFNRFYQPDIDTEELDVVRALQLSDSSELPLRLRWLAILSGGFRGSLAATGGVHTTLDAVKAVMCGAHGVQLVSELLRNGPGRIREIRDELARWLEAHEYHSLRQMQGSMSLARCPDPKAFERANYVHILQNWRAERRRSPGEPWDGSDWFE
jgi:dihydroorotate dehydrogenase (fumarate)